MPLRIDIVADLVCPWCFIGKRRLERAIGERPDLEVVRVWRAFQLNPDIPPDGIAYELFLQIKYGSGRAAARVLASLAAAGAGLGIDFAFERIRRTPNTLNAHRLVRLASAQDCGDALVEALFRAYFVEGADTGDIDCLAAIAATVGMDGAAAQRHLAGGAGTAEVLAEEERTRRAGIDAVPCFVIDEDYAVAGAQDPELFLPLFDLAMLPALDPVPVSRSGRDRS